MSQLIHHGDGYHHRQGDIDACTRCRALRTERVWAVCASIDAGEDWSPPKISDAAKARAAGRIVAGAIDSGELLADVDEFVIQDDGDGTWRQVG